ncbi:MAG: hypothetical protein ACI9PP_001989, partial [Halobacteriales archaeon]
MMLVNGERLATELNELSERRRHRAFNRLASLC